ncbi:NYN domain-containing protein [Methylophilus flavus]|uniref:NYN domain-containing protein n=1 Tax=Methylophilus flavus TaxID=640084 RepID=A0ABW3PAZ9_9PROT
MQQDNKNPRLAVLIDADNTFKVIPIIDKLFEEISTFGDARVRRIYADWTSDHVKQWKPVLPKHAIQPIQQYAHTKGKNSTDSALIIDAMDLLYTAPLDGFCIISSDSDFTRLAIRLREAGKKVYGFGEEKTPESLREACDQFVYFEILLQNKTAEEIPVQIEKDVASKSEDEPIKLVPIAKKTKQELAMDTKLVSLIRSAITALSDESGFAPTGAVRNHIVKNYSAFDSRNYGYTKFSELINAIGLFELDDQNQNLRDKRKK